MHCPFAVNSKASQRQQPPQLSFDMAVVVKTVLVDPILGDLCTTHFGVPILVVGLNRMFTGGFPWAFDPWPSEPQSSQDLGSLPLHSSRFAALPLFPCLSVSLSLSVLSLSFFSFSFSVSFFLFRFLFLYPSYLNLCQRFATNQALALPRAVLTCCGLGIVATLFDIIKMDLVRGPFLGHFHFFG